MLPEKCIFKRIRKGAYECGNILILRAHWLNERWDGKPEAFRKWKVYSEGSHIARRNLLNSFPSLKEAYQYVSTLRERQP
jgi:hypothetical protein